MEQIVFTKDAPTRLAGTAFSLKKNEWRTFPGGPIGQHRRQIIITNDDGSVKLHGVQNAGPEARKTFVVLPNTTITIFTNDEVTVQAIDGNVQLSTAGAPAIYVAETFYV